MCGVGYIYSKNTNGVTEAQDGAVILNSLKHRGSDAAGTNNLQVLSASPMVKYGDRYGIAMSTTQLVARDESDGRVLTTPEIEGRLFYDRNGRQFARLFFPSLGGFRTVFAEHGIPRIHDGYFSGEFCNG